ncbi:uncharacterized protein EV422DRAFT_529002 [Fimicolochytrium jonesii]|uniref:uncharacterized protein n=1 Tax=Fimicolochytrium jonesii TaxID=1396493 RepID=UPI0022FE790B|nr:uncharacterized protein EV422DRAFT_529002 [Fimicolochytrium jonesii]KAI8821090.1 hypothetical protein EV422DRAFT_529002 [Fimicolochytrium jonesii]
MRNTPLSRLQNGDGKDHLLRSEDHIAPNTNFTITTLSTSSLHDGDGDLEDTYGRTLRGKNSTFADLTPGALEKILDFIDEPTALLRTCTRLRNVGRNVDVRYHWLVSPRRARRLPKLVGGSWGAHAAAMTRAMDLIFRACKRRIVSAELIELLQSQGDLPPNVGSLRRDVAVMRGAGPRVWGGWKVLDDAVAEMGDDERVVEWCVAAGFVTDVDGVVQGMLGRGCLEGCVSVLRGVVEGNKDEEGADGALVSKSAAKNYPGSQHSLAGGTASLPPLKQTPTSGMTIINPHPAILDHLISQSPLHPLFLRILPHLSPPLIPASALPQLLAHPHLLTAIFTHALLPLDSILLTLAQSTAPIRKQILATLAMHQKVIEGQIKGCQEGAGRLMRRAAMEDDGETCEWLVEAGVSVPAVVMKMAKDIGSKKAIKALKKGKT